MKKLFKCEHWDLNGCLMRPLLILLTVLALLCFPLKVFTQIKGVNFAQAKSLTEYYNVPFGKLLKADLANYYYIVFKHTPTGLKRCVKRAEELVTLNNLSFGSPDIEGTENTGFMWYCPESDWVISLNITGGVFHIFLIPRDLIMDYQNKKKKKYPTIEL